MWSTYNGMRCKIGRGIILTSSRYDGVVYKSLEKFGRSHCLHGGYCILTTDGSAYDPMYFAETQCHKCPQFDGRNYIYDGEYIQRR